MMGFYERSPRVSKRDQALAKAEKNPFGVKAGQVYRTWDPRQREQADDRVTKYTVIEVGGAFAKLDSVLPDGQKRRVNIRLDRFGPKNYKLLKDA